MELRKVSIAAGSAVGPVALALVENLRKTSGELNAKDAGDVLAILSGAIDKFDGAQMDEATFWESVCNQLLEATY
ncbi:hypothetical protein [Escherichia coli]|uniref:hypothetical protein n=1 Tax=Escherichia coli TaxID=562 RepID=UPI0009293DE1|nr:hypothetical protein [Escherichia coli]EAC2092338.1 hypothetical protein [Escherichia coli]EEQ6997366.1 hypothetical protein [Escherichia coli]EET3366288.1 hypothetical protein [Escherichia coli]EET7562226.1 hypothetical protein [Escherichia coli]EET9690701.1 hypothetical protein [Escherichia coli]